MSSIRHRFLELFSIKSILSVSLSQVSLQSPSPSPNSSCFRFAVAISAACFFLHLVLLFWNHTCNKTKINNNKLILYFSLQFLIIHYERLYYCVQHDKDLSHGSKSLAIIYCNSDKLNGLFFCYTFNINFK